jgi:hypothetical protein
MFNPYTVILGLFLLGGLVVTVWGALIILKARKTQHWPCVEGVIEEAGLSSDKNDLFPNIKFCYTIGSSTYSRAMEFPVDITPTQEFAASYIEKYPVGSKVQVHYNPNNPENATLEPGLGKGDWLVLVIGLGTLLFGIAFILLDD